LEVWPDSGDGSDQITESRKQKVPGDCPALEVASGIGLVVIMVVIVVMVVPVVICAPAVAVFIPPAVAVFPTPGAGLRQLMAIFRGLRAIPSVMLGCFVKLVVSAGDTLLAVIVRAQRGGTGK
jgi:hypothetical protein